VIGSNLPHSCKEKLALSIFLSNITADIKNLNCERIMKRILAAALPLVLTTSIHAATFTPGNLVVDRIGDGSIALSAIAAPVFLDELTTAGFPVQSVALPTTVSGVNWRLVDTGSGTTAGQITRSADGQYILVPGYDAAVGTAGIATTLSSAANRVIGRVDFLGNINTSTALSDSSYSGNAIRSVASINGTAFWASGNATTAANGGVRYVSSLGGSTSLQLTTNPQNSRNVSIQGGQLFISAQSGTFRGVDSVGTGVPVTSGQTSTLLPGFDPLNTSPESAYGFVFADATAQNFLGTGFDTLWIADDRTASPGGIQRWTYNGSTWTLSANLLLGGSGNLGARGLIGSYDSGSGAMTLFATTTETSANQIIRLTDMFDGSST